MNKYTISCIIILLLGMTHAIYSAEHKKNNLRGLQKLQNYAVKTGTILQKPEFMRGCLAATVSIAGLKAGSHVISNYFNPQNKLDENLICLFLCAALSSALSETIPYAYDQFKTAFDC